MKEFIKKYYTSLQSRDKYILSVGVLIVCSILFYAFIWHPWHRAIFEMQNKLQHKRVTLVWMRQQAEIVKRGGVIEKVDPKGVGQSLMTIVQSTAKSNGLGKSITQMNPRSGGKQVNIVLEEAAFNKWVRWTSVLHQEYGVKVSQLSAERESEKPNIAEIRVTFERELSGS